MKKLFKWVFRVVVLVLALASLVVLFRNPILRILAEQQVRQETGMETILGRVRIDLRSPVVRLENVRLISPSEFGGRLFLDLPEIQLEYDSVALLFRRIRLRRVSFRLDEIRLVRTAQGRTNLDVLREHLGEGRLAARLAHWDWQYDGTETVVFAVGRLNYLDAREPEKSQEVYVGAREVTLKRPGSGEAIVQALARLAESRGALWAADALVPGTAKPPDNAAAR
ncbi:MAG: AsmA family protein [Verrucomicrobia bacterium]|nr:AsmA family protein [Verrucomicrobiota bacterium]